MISWLFTQLRTTNNLNWGQWIRSSLHYVLLSHKSLNKYKPDAKLNHIFLILQNTWLTKNNYVGLCCCANNIHQTDKLNVHLNFLTHRTLALQMPFGKIQRLPSFNLIGYSKMLKDECWQCGRHFCFTCLLPLKI